MKVGFISLGCPKNLVDTEVMLALCRRAGHTLTTDPSEADALVVNTCAFIEPARRESIDAILDMAVHKTAGSCRRLIVTGCLAERYREELQRQMPEIDVLLGLDEVPLIAEALAGAPRDGRHAVSLIRPGRGAPTYLYDADTPREIATPRHFAYIKVAEGCDCSCSFCVIPTLRGSYRSRPAESIVREARALADRGVREIILISQDTTFYGVDRGERGALGRLLAALDRIDGLAWIRLLYLYPTTLTDDTLAAIADNGKVCRYVDLPLQHVSRRVLRGMRRPGGRAAYARLIGRIRHRVPGVALRTAFIVGFPGETAAEFAEIVSFVGESRFDHVGVFAYSHEEGTLAGALVDSVPPRIKRQRQRTLMRLQRDLVARANRARIGDRVEVLIDGPAPESPLVVKGRLESQAPEIDSVVYLTGADPTGFRAGDLIAATVTGARGYDLVCRPAGEAATSLERDGRAASRGV